MFIPLCMLLLSGHLAGTEILRPLPRIGTQVTEDGLRAFVCRDTGKPFVPRGFNHAVLEHDSTGWHAAFNTGKYDPEASEAMLAEMARLGANTIRVWAWGAQNETGFCGGLQDTGLNEAYMDHFLDFLRRATAHGIYVIPILDQTPHNAHYNRINKEAGRDIDDPSITGHNRQYLCAGPLAAKAAAARDFVGHIRKADPGLLSTVLGWALANEICLLFTQGPFNKDNGEVRTATGRTYDMGDRAQRQACYDESILHWANTLADAINEIDPDAMVTVGMWTSDAHGRPPVNALIPDDRDPRIPPRPSVLGGPESRLDFIGVHIYPWDGTSKVRPETHERDKVVLPAIVGEFGVFKNKPIDTARLMMREMHDQACELGYTGFLHWVWDLSMVEGQTWSAVEEGLAAYLMGLACP
jgi:hypothetical protein